jgi:hypothetical protein
MRERRTLRTAGRARRVEDCGKIVRLRVHGDERGRFVARAVPQLAAAAVDGEHERAVADRLDHADAPGAAHDHARLGVAEEILELALLIRRVERQVDESGAQAREVEGEHLPMLVRLHGDAIARHAARAHECVRDARGRLRKLVIMHDTFVWNEQARLLGAGREMGFDQRMEIGIHRVGFAALLRASHGRARIASIISYR